MTAHRRRLRGATAGPDAPDPAADARSGSLHQITDVSPIRENGGGAAMGRRAGLTILVLAVVVVGSSAVTGAVCGHSRTQPGVGPQFVGSAPSRPGPGRTGAPRQAVLLPYVPGVIAIQSRPFHPVPNPEAATEL
jgi:hypothetical protein